MTSVVLSGPSFADVEVLLDEYGIPRTTLVDGIEIPAVSDVSVLCESSQIVKCVITVNARRVRIDRP